MIRRRYFLLLILMFAGTALWAVAQPVADEAADNRRKLEAIRKNPDQLARLRENLQQFNALPEKKRDKLVQLDHEMHGWSAAKQARYIGVLDRYADWLE